MADRFQNIKVPCRGGLIENVELLEHGLIEQLLGTASQLINYEPSLEGGYERIKGFQKYSTTTVPGLASSPLLGGKVAHDGVYVSRKNTGSTSMDVFYGTGSTWGTKLNSANLSTSSTKHRFISFSISEEVVILTTGQDAARHFDSSQTETVINGTGTPTAPKYAEMIKNRLVLAPASNSSSIAISSPNLETDFDGTNGAIEINVGDRVTGLKRFRDILYIFCTNSIFKLVGNTSSDFTIQSVTRSIGCISHDSIQEIAGDLIYLAPDGLRSLAGTDRIGDVDLALVSRAIQPTFRTLISGKGEDDIASCLIRDKSQYRIFFIDTTLANDADASGFLGRASAEKQFEWSKLEGLNMTWTDSEYLSTGSELSVFGHPTSGLVCKMESGNDFDGTGIPYLYATPDIMMSDALFRKVLQKITVYTKVDGDLTLNLAAILNFNEADVLQPAVIPLTFTGGQAKYGTALYGTGVYSSFSVQVFKKNLIGSCFEVKFKFSGSTSEAPHRIDAFECQYLQKGQR